MGETNYKEGAIVAIIGILIVVAFFGVAVNI